MNNTIKNITIISAIAIGLFLAGMFTSDVSAAPAVPGTIEISQPDGSGITVEQWGDEWINGYETADGFSIVQNNEGWWVYATETSAELPGELTADFDRPMVVGSVSPNGLPTHLRPELDGSAQMSGITAQGINNTGTQYVVVLMVEFNDRKGTYAAADLADRFFGAKPSMRDYYLEASYGKLDLQPVADSSGANDGIVGWLTLPYNHPNTSNRTGITNATITIDALKASDKFVNYAQYDLNGDGKISSNELHIVVVVAGFERAYSTQSPSVWAHRWSIFPGYNGLPPVLDGVELGNANNNSGYIQIGEIQGDHLSTIGTIVHEMGHDLGMPDLYDISSADGAWDGTGAWSLMASGSWNTVPGKPLGSSPSLPIALMKYYQGWLEPRQVAGSVTDLSLNPIQNSADAVIIGDNPGGMDWRFNTQTGNGSYLLIANRQRVGYDAGLPGAGMMIWAVDETVTPSNMANSNPSKPLVRLIEADQKYHLYDVTDFNIGDAGDPFTSGSFSPSQYNAVMASADLASTPADSFALHNISNEGLVMTANYINTAAMTLRTFLPAITR